MKTSIKSATHLHMSGLSRKIPALLLALAGMLAVTVASGQEVAPTGAEASTAIGPPPAAPTNVIAKDRPKDAGDAIIITWTKSADDGQGRNNVDGYVILRAESPSGPWETVGRVPAGSEKFVDPPRAEQAGVAAAPPIQPRKDYYYKVLASAGSQTHGSPVVGPVRAYPNWFNWQRANVLIGAVICSALVLYFIRRAGRGEELYIRPIAGLQSVDDAIGRATEMGRPALFVTGLDSISSIATIAAMAILGRIARRAARYDTRMIVPCCDPVVMVAEREIVRQAYLDVGRPEAYNEDDVFFVTDQQFGYVAAVDGIMLREKPAANFFMGGFYAESLILAETGAATGAIQIAGTDSVTQLPFFVTVCDYTLMGEELYAATAYLERDPRLLGSLKGQDWSKVLFAAAILLGTIVTTLIAVHVLPESWLAFLHWFAVE